VPPSEAREFCDWLFAGGAGPLGGLHYSVLALGDRSYPHFCRCGKQLDAALEKAGAAPLAPRGDIDKEDWPAVDGWLAAVEGALPGLGLRSLSETGLSSGQSAAGGDEGRASGCRAASRTPAAAPTRPLRPPPSPRACTQAWSPTPPPPDPDPPRSRRARLRRRAAAQALLQVAPLLCFRARARGAVHDRRRRY
jgi:hypothetical protein